MTPPPLEGMMAAILTGDTHQVNDLVFLTKSHEHTIFITAYLCHDYDTFASPSGSGMESSVDGVSSSPSLLIFGAHWERENEQTWVMNGLEIPQGVL